VILPGITSSDEESTGLQTLPFHGINSDSAGNYQLIDVESTVRMGFPPVITSSGTRNPPKEYDSAGNNQLMEADLDRQDQNVQKILKAVTITGSASTNPIYYEGQLLKKFKYENVIKTKNKSDPALLGDSYLFNEIKKDTKISCPLKVVHLM
jgi:hypothetical protein